jgi:hypothetical protein
VGPAQTRARARLVRVAPATGVNFVLPTQPGGRFKCVADIFDEGTKIREVQQGAKVY